MPKGVYERKPRAPRIAPVVWCCVEGCERQANRPKMRLCERHYYRQRRYGSYEHTRTRKPFYVDRGGYIRVCVPGHPLSKAGNWQMLEHRVVYYDAHGPGPFNCHWCKKHVEWAGMHIDHLNDTPSDNRLENLVASCPRCNTGRGFDKGLATRRDRYSTRYTLGEESLTLGQWAERLGVSRESVQWRLDHGWPLERALTEKRGKFGPRRAA